MKILGYDLIEWLLFSVMGLSIIFCACLVAMMVWMGVSINIATPVTENVSIYNLNDAMGTYGSFALGSGYVDSYPVYIAYVESGNGGYRAYTMGSTISTIYMDSDTFPYVKVTRNHAEFIVPFTSQPVSYDIHVPKGTIIKEYTIGGK